LHDAPLAPSKPASSRPWDRPGARGCPVRGLPSNPALQRTPERVTCALLMSPSLASLAMGCKTTGRGVGGAGGGGRAPASVRAAGSAALSARLLISLYSLQLSIGPTLSLRHLGLADRGFVGSPCSPPLDHRHQDAHECVQQAKLAGRPARKSSDLGGQIGRRAPANSQNACARASRPLL
jgi:hypothetical protein